MNSTELVQNAVKQGAQMYFAPDGALYSMDPPQTLFGLTYHAGMIPPFKPEHTLILGYGFGTIAGLMRMIWGNDLKITGVDVQKYDLKYTEYKMKIMDAFEFVKDCTDSIFKTRFDYIVVDLWDGKTVPGFVFSAEFAVRMREMNKGMVCINTTADDFKKLKSFMDYGFEFQRHNQLEDNIVSLWSVIEK